MSLEHDTGPCVLIETEHANDTFTSTLVNDILHVRLLSVRCQEAQAQNLANQDYAQVSIQMDGSSLCFCVCDGVGSSYKGDFAAHYLGNNLMRWLHSLDDICLYSPDIASRLTNDLDLWAEQAQEHLRQLTMPEGTPGLVREVLEELRDTYGSETVFLCGRIDRAIPSKALDTDDVHAMQLLVCWMGNVTAQLFTAEEQYVMLGMDDDSVARWSTLLGARGPLTIRSMYLSAIERLIVHTDGLDAISLSLCDMDDAAWQAQTQRLLLQPRNDDMTALELRWLYPGSNEVQ